MTIELSDWSVSAIQGEYYAQKKALTSIDEEIEAAQKIVDDLNKKRTLIVSAMRSIFADCAKLDAAIEDACP